MLGLKIINVIKRGPMLFNWHMIASVPMEQPRRTWLYLWHDDVIKWKHFPRHWPFVRGIHRWPVVPPHKGPVKRKMFSFDDINMWHCTLLRWDLSRFCKERIQNAKLPRESKFVHFERVTTIKNKNISRVLLVAFRRTVARICHTSLRTAFTSVRKVTEK